jgi:hypothetical protein
MSTTTASAVVAAADEAVREADAQTEGKTPPSREVVAQERLSEHASKRGKAKSAKPAAEKKEPKYDERIRAITKRAQDIRGKKNAVAPVTCQRVEALLKKEKTDAAAVVKMFKSIKDATAFAAGDKEIKQPGALKELGAKTSDPFARGRGLTAICLAIREQK